MRLTWLVGLWLVALGCTPEMAVDVVPVELSEIQVVTTDAQFVSVRDMAVDSRSVWILDARPPFLARVSLEGRATQFGGEGQGPGEFSDPWAIQAGVGRGRVGVRAWDRANTRVSWFDTLGTLLRSEPLGEEGWLSARTDIRDVSYANPFRIRGEGDTTVLARFPALISRTGDMVRGSLFRVDTSANHELVRFADHMEEGSSALQEWIGVPLWDVCDGALVLWSPALGAVVWLDLDGKEIGTTKLQTTPEPITLNDIEAYLRWMARLELGPEHEAAGIDYRAMARVSRARFAESQPGATDIRCQPGGVAWLQQFSTLTDPLGRGQRWRMVSMQGDVRDYAFPSDFSPMVFTNRGAYGVLEGPDGYQQLAWWEGILLP